MAKIYSHIALGGTFDRLHIGHQHLIDTAASRSEHFTIGLTSKGMIQGKQYSGQILPYLSREQELKGYLKFKNYYSRSRIVKLSDLYGTTLSDPKIKALAVTPHTLSGAEKINSKRQELNQRKLPIITADLIKDDSDDYISSTKIRLGLINRQGQVYQRLFAGDSRLSSAQKKTLQIPQGVLLNSVEKVQSKLNLRPPRVALVGDYITQWFEDHQLSFDFSIVDGLNQRQVFTLKLRHFDPMTKLIATNPAGEISAQAAKSIFELMHFPSGILNISGEEDLTAIPLLLALPLNSQIFYGQPGQGVVMISATEVNKQKFAKFINPSF